MADFPHTTWKPTPGMANFENIQFQLIDTPPVPTEFIDPGLTDLLRRTDIIVAVVDIQADPLQQLEDTMTFLNGLRIFPAWSAHSSGLEEGPVHQEGPAVGKQG